MMPSLYHFWQDHSTGIIKMWLLDFRTQATCALTDVNHLEIKEAFLEAAAK